MKKLKIAYITSIDPRDKHSWSGTTHYIWKILENELGFIDLLGPAQPRTLLFFLKIFQFISIYVFSKRFDFYHSKLLAKAYGRIFTKKLEKNKYDLIISPGGIAFTAYIKTKTPIILILDRSLGNAFNYHSVLSNLWEFSKKQSLETERVALEKAYLIIYSSKWAADHATNTYKIPNKKIIIQPFGANLDSVPSIDEILLHKKFDKIKLFFLGTYWKNKGADIAVNALDILLKNGIDAELIISGCQPPIGFSHPRVKLTGFINKNSEEGKHELEKYFMESNIFILPTRFEAFGIVFCEASAYGLISLGTNTGGIPSAIKDGINGFLIETNDNGIGYAEKIIEIFKDKEKMKSLCLQSRKYFEKNLNWNTWVKNLLKTELIQNIKPDLNLEKEL